MDKFKCMLAKPLDERKLSFPCYVSPKLDGIRAQYYKGEFYTRNKKKLKGLETLKLALLNSDLPGDYYLDGELMVPGVSFQVSSGLIRSFNQTPKAVFHVFDAPYLERPQEERLSSLNRWFPLSTSLVKLVAHQLIESAAEVHAAYKVYQAMGYEGAMVKALHGMYDNKRSAAWMKMKSVETYDVVCTGFFRGQGRLSDTLGGVIVELDGVSVRVGGGFSDADRDEIWYNKDKYRGLVAEVACQELTPAGSMRHPRLITWRFDKD